MANQSVGGADDVAAAIETFGLASAWVSHNVLARNGQGVDRYLRAPAAILRNNPVGVLEVLQVGSNQGNDHRRCLART